ncbi:MAG: hypothetical protein V1743_06530, partial [Nanoarchaeota archaeon]
MRRLAMVIALGSALALNLQCGNGAESEVAERKAEYAAQGQRAFLAGDYAAAISQFRQAEKCPPDSIDVYVEEGLALSFGA